MYAKIISWTLLSFHQDHTHFLISYITTCMQKKEKRRKKTASLAKQIQYMFFSNTKTLKFNKNHFLNKYFNIIFNQVHYYLCNAQLTNNWNNIITGVNLSQYTAYRVIFAPCNLQYTVYRVIFAPCNFILQHLQTVSPRLGFALTHLWQYETFEFAQSYICPLTTRAKGGENKMEANISLFTVYICYMLSLHFNNYQYTLNNINVCGKLELFAHRTKKVVHPFNIYIKLTIFLFCFLLFQFRT